MDIELSPLLVVCLVAALVLLINGMLLFLFTRPETREQFRLIQKAAHTARDPWQEEKGILAELHERVAELNPQGEEPEDGSR